MQNVLLPTDFSDNSRNAISYAINFYRNEPCNFTLLHSYKVNGYRQNSKFVPVPGQSNIDRMRLETEKKLAQLIQEIKKRYPNPRHSFTAIASNYQLIIAIKEELRKRETEVIMIGTQGSTGAYEVAYGSNTIRLMEDIKNCPILAIPSHVRFSAIKEIVLASGFKVTPRAEELDFIKILLRKTHASLRVLHIVENGPLSKDQKKHKEELKNLLLDVNHSFHSLSHVTVPIGIYCFTESRGSDMITFVNKRHSFFQNVLFNPLYKNLGNYSQIPVLIMQTEVPY